MKLQSQFGMINIDQNLIQKLLQHSDNYEGIEKVIYLYLEICNNFSFSMKYFLEEILEPHNIITGGRLEQDMNLLVKNNITCHKFSVLFSMIVSNFLGYSAKIIFNNPMMNFNKNHYDSAFCYGMGHQSVIVNFNNLSLKFDPLVSFLGSNSDFYNVKVGTQLKGIEVIKGNSTEIQKMIQRVYQKFRGHNIYSQEEFETFNYSNNIEELNQDLQNCSLEGMDLLSYLLTCKKRYFPSSSLYFLLDKEPQKDSIEIDYYHRNIKATWATILIVKDNYYIYQKETQKFIPISKEIVASKLKKEVWVTRDRFKIKEVEDSLINLKRYEAMFAGDELYNLKEYLEQLPEECQNFFKDYLEKYPNCFQALEEIIYLDNWQYPCELESIKTTCLNRKKCQK